MKKQLQPRAIAGQVKAPSSKSMAHRLLICAALSKTRTRVLYDTGSRDIDATIRCLEALKQGEHLLPCGESGSTLRFLLPVAAALGKTGEFLMEGRLPQRPMAPLDEELRAHGVHLEKKGDRLLFSGQLQPGDFTLPGDVSSQYISGLLFALPLLDAPSRLTVTGKLESAPYIHMTLAALQQFGVVIREIGSTYHITPAKYHGAATAQVEGDWSNAAFWLTADKLSGPVIVTGLDKNSLQGDKAIVPLLEEFDHNRDVAIDAAAIPDLVPILSVAAAAHNGRTTIYNAARLRLKESDRLAAVEAMLTALGGDIVQTDDGLVICGGKPLTGGTVDSCGDHRIAMAAAIASCLCLGPVTIEGPQAVEKSYPHFWQDFEALTNTR